MIRKLFDTAVFRLSLVYALIFSVVASLGLVSLYWVAEAQLNAQIDSSLLLESQLLLRSYDRTGSLDDLVQVAYVRNQVSGARLLFSLPISRHERDLMPMLQPDYVSEDKTQILATTRFSALKILPTPKGINSDEVRILLILLPAGYQLIIGTSFDELHQLLKRLQMALLWSIVVIFAVVILGGSLMGYKVLQRINAVTSTAAEIVNGDLARRMPVSGYADEFDRLSQALNQMLERIQQLLQGMHEVTDNLAHDLRNPLNRLRHRLESIRGQSTLLQLAKPTIPTSTDPILDDAIQDVDGLINTFNALLSITQVEAGSQRQVRERVDFSSLVRDLSETYQVVAEEQGLAWQLACVDGLVVQGNYQLLAQLLTNLLDNALKYTKMGSVHLEADLDAKQVRLVVADTGAGIPATEREAVFKRFYRLEAARSSPGNGLGLSLVKAIVDWHKSTITLEDNQPQGLRVVVRLPLSEPV